MPKPMLKLPQSNSSTLLSATKYDERQQMMQMNKMEVDRILRKKRSKVYLAALHKLDAGGHVHNQKEVDDIINTIENEFPEIELSGILLGFVAICYLGKPYEVHTLDLTGNIIEHYQSGQPLPEGLEKARSIALRGGYDFIEVYVDCCRAISYNGTVSVISY